MVGTLTLPRRITGLPATRPSPFWVVSCSMPTVLVFPGAPCGQSVSVSEAPTVNAASSTLRGTNLFSIVDGWCGLIIHWAMSIQAPRHDAAGESGLQPGFDA